MATENNDIAVLELNDYQINLTMADLTIQTSGYATIDKGKLLLGQSAQAQARRQPLVSYQHYWNQLNVEPIQTSNAKLRHHADFAHQHLLGLHDESQGKLKQLVLSLPASFTHQQIALLLGICQQCPFEVIGIIDSAVPAVAGIAEQGKHLYIDIQLHQCLVSQIDVAGDINVTNTDIVAGTGISHLFTNFARYLANEFISQCRYDPMHDADAEQQLFNLLNDLIDSDNQQEECQLTLAGHQVSLNRQTLIRHATPLFDSVFDAIDAAKAFDKIYVSERVVAIKELYHGLTQRYESAIKTVPSNNLSQQIINNINAICGNEQGLVYTTELPNPGVVKANSKTSTRTNTRTSPTHLLIDDCAYPLSAKPWYISSTTDHGLSASVQPQDSHFAIVLDVDHIRLSLGQNPLSKVWVNGQQAQDAQVLASGDKISLSEQADTHNSLRCIRVFTTEQSL